MNKFSNDKQDDDIQIKDVYQNLLYCLGKDIVGKNKCSTLLSQFLFINLEFRNKFF